MRRLVTIAILLVALLPLSVSAQTVNQYPGTAASSIFLVKAAPGTTTTGTTEQSLYTVTVPANSLPAVGDSVVITAFATTAANTNNKYLRLKQGTCAGVITAATVTASSAATVALQTQIMRTGATTAVTLEPVFWYTSTSALSSAYKPLTGLDFTADITLPICAVTASAAGDLTLAVVTAYLVR